MVEKTVDLMEALSVNVKAASMVERRVETKVIELVVY